MTEKLEIEYTLTYEALTGLFTPVMLSNIGVKNNLTVGFSTQTINGPGNSIYTNHFLIQMKPQMAI